MLCVSVVSKLIRWIGIYGKTFLDNGQIWIKRKKRRKWFWLILSVRYYKASSSGFQLLSRPPITNPWSYVLHCTLLLNTFYFFSQKTEKKTFPRSVDCVFISFWDYWTHADYSRTSMARTPLGPWKFVRDSGSSSLGRLLIVPHQEPQWRFLWDICFKCMLCVLIRIAKRRF